MRAAFLCATALSAAACQSSKSSGGPVLGPVDNHCFLNPDGGAPGGMMAAQQTEASACNGGMVAGADAGPHASTYGPTMYNAGGNDDDCKYLLNWATPGVAENDPVTFTVAAVTAIDGKPATGAALYAEVFLANADPTKTHLSPTLQPQVTEVQPGVYTLGPVLFDLPGQWTVRFHFHATCLDLLPTSPHGHAAFYVQVP